MKRIINEQRREESGKREEKREAVRLGSVEFLLTRRRLLSHLQAPKYKLTCSLVSYSGAVGCSTAFCAK